MIPQGFGPILPSMCEDDHNHHDDPATSVTGQSPQPPPDPLARVVARFRSAVEQGDFRRARHILEEGKDEVDEARHAQLEHERKRLRPDRAAVVTAVVCGVILIVLATTTLFH